MVRRSGKSSSLLFNYRGENKDNLLLKESTLQLGTKRFQKLIRWVEKLLCTVGNLPQTVSYCEAQ